jgi:cytochrome c oxidase subunit I+III
MPRRELNVSDLPTVVFGHRSIIWLGTIGMMMIEATAFALVVASYFYLRTRSNGWPPGLQPPNLLFGTANTL